MRGVNSLGEADVSEFVARLVEWQASLGMNDSEFAAYLGISKSYWSLLRSGRRSGGLGAEKLLLRVLREKPEFEFYVTAALRKRLREGEGAA